ncbi:hypothetical protein [Roseateles sp.]|uniref:hypothetical protein n=1 Tax=Roseateles sp. TaxID=1971397 RepID=UPI003266600A
MNVQLRSRLAQRLDGEIAATAAMPARCAVLQVQRAILWLRHGREAEARAELNRLQASALANPRIELAAWLHLAEGLVAYFGAFGGGACERVRRARVMANAVGLNTLQTLCDAWLAQMAFVDRDIDQLVGHATAVLAAHADPAASCRVASALGMAWDLSENQAAAAHWYAWGRRGATTEGDDASLAALLYNQMQMRALRIRHAALAGAPGEAPAVMLGVDSIGNFDGAVGGSARADLTPLLRAQLLTMRGDFAAAARLLEAHLPTAMSSGLARVGYSLLADLAWCWANTGEPLRARALADQAAVEVLAEDAAYCDLDECAVLHARLAQVYAKLGEEALAAREAEAATVSWVQDAAQRRHWAERLTAAGLGTPPR